MIIVKIEHLRTCELCTKGGRAWFARYGLDWQKFLNEGYPVEVIEATGDALALRVAAVARAEG